MYSVTIKYFYRIYIYLALIIDWELNKCNVNPCEAGHLAWRDTIHIRTSYTIDLRSEKQVNDVLG